ncbi:50S ribosomal protein L36 [uncultured Bifidobacterium sp.]|nr:50S ribosomal protein L36 [uncultured Bifidobacterium sp.]
MKVKSSIRSLARKDGSYVVRRRRHLYVINKKNPHWKARQG